MAVEVTEGTTVPERFVRTFLFTDIEGSTRLLQELGPDAPAVFARHHELLREVIEAHEGVVQRTEGDSFFATFDVAEQAVAAAIDLQRGIAAEPWPSADGLRVRVGLHTGEATVVASEHVGLDVHRAARIMSVGWGGQILVSEQTASLLPAGGMALRDLGRHRLKDLTEPVQLLQVAADGLRTDFPALRSLDAVPNNLPVQLTSFVGREQEIREAVALLEHTRLLTLTGPGGTGKTRLALQAAAEVADRFKDGAFFVPLAPITDPTLVVSAIAATLGLANTGKETPLEQAIGHLAEREVLLVLDNFEQVLDAAADVAKLLSAAEDIAIIVTSRAPLRISGEQECPVRPLGLPTTGDGDADPAASEAAKLFVARAMAVQPSFQLTAANVASVTQIVKRLDGLPLAIELAATRMRVLSVDAIAQRLSQALDLLSSGARDAPDRQRTLRGAIVWSHDLLDATSQRLFARMSVFRGGIEFDHLEQTCSPGLGGDTFDALSTLVEQSLVRRHDHDHEHGPRYVMLETIRDFAVERLAATDEDAEVQRRHAEVFLAFAEEAAPHLTGPDSGRWLDHLEADHDNLRAAIQFAAANDTRMALALCAALFRLWQIRGHLHEAQRTVEMVLALEDASDHPAELAAAEECAGGIAYWQADLPRTMAHYERALALYRQVGDDVAVARSLYNKAFSYGPEESARSMVEFEAALAAYDDLGDDDGRARTHWGMTVASFWLADYEAMLHHTDQCLPWFQEHNQSFDLAWALHMRGMALYALRRLDEATTRFHEAMRMFMASNDPSGFYLVVADMALVAEARKDHERSLRLMGAAERLAEETGAGLLAMQLDTFPRDERSEDVLPPDRVAACMAEGRALTRDQAIALALEA